MRSFFAQFASAGPWAYAGVFVYLALIAFLAIVATLSSKPHRRKAALEVLRLLWVLPLTLRRRERPQDQRIPSSRQRRRS